jgi:hypothetical protein
MFQKPNPWKWSTFIISLAFAYCITWYLVNVHPVGAPPERIIEDEEFAIHSHDSETADPNLVMHRGYSSAPNKPVRKISKIDTGDNFNKILLENGISYNQIVEILKKTRKTFDLSRLMTGHELILVFSPEDQKLVGIEYEISADYRLIVTIDEDNINAYKKTSETG